VKIMGFELFFQNFRPFLQLLLPSLFFLLPQFSQNFLLLYESVPLRPCQLGVNDPFISCLSQHPQSPRVSILLHWLLWSTVNVSLGNWDWNLNWVKLIRLLNTNWGVFASLTRKFAMEIMSLFTLLQFFLEEF
jgi:hypothetical protein